MGFFNFLGTCHISIQMIFFESMIFRLFPFGGVCDPLPLKGTQVTSGHPERPALPLTQPAPAVLRLSQESEVGCRQ